jgi:hypothetical protein
MSIAAMATISTLKSATTDPNTPNPGGGAQPHNASGQQMTGVPSSTLESLMLWIPTETVGAYIAAQAIVGTPTLPASGHLYDASFGAQWLLVLAGALITWLAIIALKAQKSRAAQPTAVKFKLPSFELAASTAAFLLWVLALPQSPAFSWSSWDEKYGALLVIFGTPIISLIGNALNQDPPRSTT